MTNFLCFSNQPTYIHVRDLHYKKVLGETELWTYPCGLSHDNYGTRIVAVPQ